MSDTKFCPFTDNTCLQGICALWDSRYECCSIKLVAKKLEDISKYMKFLSNLENIAINMREK